MSVELLSTLITCLVILLLLSYGIFNKRFVSRCQYWAQRGVTQYQELQVWLNFPRSLHHDKFYLPQQFPMGSFSANFMTIMYNKITVHEVILRQYKEFKGERYFGTYWPISAQPILTIRDLDLVQQMTGKEYKVQKCKICQIFLYLPSVRDFDHFTDRSFGGLMWDKGSSKNDILWKTSLFTMKGGNNWRLVRQTLNPAFTLSKMKIMLQESIHSTVHIGYSDTVRNFVMCYCMQ